VLDPVLAVGDELPGHLHPGQDVGVHREDLLDERDPIGERGQVLGAEEHFQVRGRTDLVRGGGALVQELLLAPERFPGAVELRGPVPKLGTGVVQDRLDLGQLGLSLGQVYPQGLDLGGERPAFLLGLGQLILDRGALLLGGLDLLLLGLDL
jgi:hypothetical protein